MSVIDVRNLLTEISADAPSGNDLEYDPVFGEMERAAQGKPEQSLGDALTPSEPPDWRAVHKLAVEMLARSKDLRMGVYLLRALMHSDGYLGFCDGLLLIRGLLERYWATLHPQLDAEDNNDPIFRINTLVTLCDRGAVLNILRETPLINSKILGRFGLSDIAIARGEVQPSAGSEESVPDMPTIDAAFMDVKVEELQATVDAITDSIDNLAAIDALLMDKVGSDQAPDLGELEGLLMDAQSIMNEQLSKRGVSDIEPPVAKVDAAIVPSNVSNVSAVSGEIRSREDAIQMMEKIGDYFKNHEPSSPIPLFMERAKRLTNMNFLDILKDVAPEGLKQAKNVGGVSND